LISNFHCVLYVVCFLLGNSWPLNFIKFRHRGITQKKTYNRKSHDYRTKYFPPIRGKNLLCIVSHTLLMETLRIHVHVHRQIALKSKTPQRFGLNNPQIGIK